MKVSAFTFIKNGQILGYPFLQSIQSILPIVDEFVINVGESEDNTLALIQSIDNKNKKILSIGDNLNTDIKGANLLNYDSLLISNGIHKNEIQKEGIDIVSKKYEAIVNYIQTELKW